MTNRKGVKLLLWSRSLGIIKKERKQKRNENRETEKEGNGKI